MHRASFVSLVSFGLVLSACGSAAAPKAVFPTPLTIDDVPADGCGQFELMALKGTDDVRAATDVRARCDSSYICSPRVAGSRVELHGLAPGVTKLHLEYTDPKTGEALTRDIPVTIVPAAPDAAAKHAHFGTPSCGYLPVGRQP